MNENNDLALQALTDFLNAVEAGIMAARQTIKAEKVGLDVEDIRWSPAEGSKGPYERSGDVENPNFSALLNKLKAHGGKLTHSGYFYWKFGASSIIGRKKRK